MPPEAFDCCGSHPQLFGFVMEKRSKLGCSLAEWEDFLTAKTQRR
jgi:hypothetical protein